VTWVAASDLADPTPFLDRGNLLLTTGRQLDPQGEDATGEQRYTGTDAYVAALRRRGVSAVGFGTRVLHAGTPPSLVEACTTHAMPLFEVPYHIPFIAVVRAAADLIDAAGHRRAAWALAATRAVSAAVLQTSPVDAVLGELRRQLGCGVVLVDQRGRARAVHGLLADDPIVAAAGAEATSLLRRGHHTGATVSVPFPPPPAPAGRPRPTSQATTAYLTMQTIGPDTGLRSVLVLVGPSGIDSAEQAVVASTVALLWFAIGEGTGGAVRASLRRALWHLLVSGEADVVRTEAPSVGMCLPGEPVRAAAWSPGLNTVTARALQAACDGGHAMVFSTVDDVVLACVGAQDAPGLGALDPERGVGLSEPVTFADLPAAVDRARRAARYAAPGKVVALDDPGAGVLAAVATMPELADRAHAMLHLLVGDDSAERLLEALAAWLAANGSYEAAARTLGLHRHTLSARVARAGGLLGRDLDDVDTRTDLWLALRMTGRV